MGISARPFLASTAAYAVVAPDESTDQRDPADDLPSSGEPAVLPVIVAVELANVPSSPTSTPAGGMRDLVSWVPAVRRGGALVGKAVVDSLGRQSVSAQGVVR